MLNEALLRKFGKSPRYEIITASVLILTQIIWVCRGFTRDRTSIHDTSFTPHESSRFHNRSYRFENITDDIAIFRSSSPAELALILEISKDSLHKVESIFSNTMAHDILLCTSKCNVDSYLSLIPQIFARLKFMEGDEMKLNYSYETPLDLIALSSKIFGEFIFQERVNSMINSEGYPSVSYVITSRKFTLIPSFVASLNRMEKKMIHGPMLYEVIDNQYHVPLSFLFPIILVVIVVQLMIAIIDVDFFMVLLSCFAYVDLIFCIPLLFYTLFKNTSRHSANIALSLRILVYMLYCPFNCYYINLFAQILFVSPFPIYAFAYIATFYYIDVPYLVYLPLVVTYCGIDIRSYYLRREKSKTKEKVD